MAHHGRFRQFVTIPKNIHRDMHFARLTRPYPSRHHRRWEKWVMALSVEDAKQTGLGEINLDQIARENWDELKRFRRMMKVPEEDWGFGIIIGGGYIAAPRFIRRAI